MPAVPEVEVITRALEDAVLERVVARVEELEPAGVVLVQGFLEEVEPAPALVGVLEEPVEDLVEGFLEVEPAPVGALET